MRLEELLKKQTTLSESISTVPLEIQSDPDVVDLITDELIPLDLIEKYPDPINTASLSNFPLHTLNTQKERTFLNKFNSGAKFGALFASSNLLIYMCIAAFSKNEFSNSGWAHEVNKLNLMQPINAFFPFKYMIPNDDPVAGCFLSFLTYIQGAALVFGLGNIALKAIRNWQGIALAYGDDFKKIKNTDDINLLWKLIQKGELNLSYYDMIKNGEFSKSYFKSNWDKIAAAATFVLFSLPNYQYDKTYLHVGDKAIPLFHKFMSFYGSLNDYAGKVSFAANVSLNQWFAGVVILFLLFSYKALMLTRRYFHKDATASWPYVLWNAGIILALSTAGSIPFLSLTSEDDVYKEYTPFEQYLTLASALAVYALVLHIIGTISITDTLNNIWKKIEKWTTKSQDYEDEVPPPYTTDELEAEVTTRIRKLPPEAILTAYVPNIIADARKSLEKRSKSAADTYQDYVTSVLAITGPLGLSILLLAYYLLVNDNLSEKYWSALGLEGDDAASRMLSFVFFSVFSMLVLETGYNTMKKLFNGAVHKIKEIHRSKKIIFDSASSSDLTYEERFLPVNCKESIVFGALSPAILSAQGAILYIVPLSAATLLVLMEEYRILIALTAYIAVVYTTLFNSHGFSSGLGRIKETLKDWILYRDRSTLLSEKHRLFQGVRYLPGCRFEFNELKTSKNYGDEGSDSSKTNYTDEGSDSSKTSYDDEDSDFSDFSV